MGQEEPRFYIDGKPVQHFLGETYTNGEGDFYVQGSAVKIEKKDGKLEGTVREELIVFVKLDPELVSQFGIDEAVKIAGVFSEQEHKKSR